MEFVKAIFQFMAGHILLWNMLFAVVIVFFERKNPKSVWAWLLLLVFLPYIGFIFYLFLGQDLHKRKLFREKEVSDRLRATVKKQEQQIKSKELVNSDPGLKEYTDLIMYNLETSNAILTNDNDIDFFFDGNEKFDALLRDMEKAERFIHMQYYIVKNDLLFQKIEPVLVKKAEEGVEVRILIDGMGGRFVPKRVWKRLRDKGIEVAIFFPALLGRFQPRINYRNHRKIVVIDNKIGYVGGFNVAKEYIDMDKKFGHWRDTHFRIRGSAVYGLQVRFLLDWNYASGQDLFQNRKLFDGYESGTVDFSKIQIISSGPDNSLEQIRDNYLRLISGAKKRIYIQTPYFIPDEAIFQALLLATRSGVEVNLMIPSFPDHPFVYWATYSYMGELVMAGAKCYTYDKGFLHAKGLIADGQVFCYGTANMDIRSFELNFEVNAVVYDAVKAKKMEEVFVRDLSDCSLITAKSYEERGLYIRMKEQVSRLLSPLL